MMILADIGEIGIHTQEGAVYVLRPSLYAMSRLGSPTEIVAMFAEVMHDFGGRNDDQLITAAGVLYDCATTDIPPIFGGAKTIEVDEPFLQYGKQVPSRVIYEPGIVPESHILPLSRCLLKHGIIGAIPAPPRAIDDEPEYLEEFNARDHVSLAVAHLGYAEREAWDLTMTSLVGALRAKYPPDEKKTPGSKAPTNKQLEEADKWLDQVNALRGN